MITYEAYQLGGYLVTDRETGRTMLVQTDWDFPGLARTFGWSLSSVQTTDEEDVASMRDVLERIDAFWNEGDAPLHKDALLGPDAMPIAQVVRKAIHMTKGCNHDGTDGTIDCPDCGMTASHFLYIAQEWLYDMEGEEVEDPGYFSGGEG